MGAALISLSSFSSSHRSTGWSLHLNALHGCHLGGSAAEALAAGPTWYLCSEHTPRPRAFSSTLE